MAAIQWSGGKMHGATEAKASMMHDDKDMRMIHNHMNPDIDVSKTPNNFSYRGLSYYAKCKRYDEILGTIRIKRKSSGKNQNVTLQKLEAAIPAGMQDGDNYDPILVRSWVNDVGKILEDEYGDLLIDIDCHVDEVHLYLDPRKNREDPNRYSWSRIHLHAAVVPGVWEAVKGKDGNPVLDEDGKPIKELVLNGFRFSNKRNIIRLNQRIQDMTKEKYGMDFMTGKSKGQVHHTVEDLKRWTAETMREEGLQMVSDREELKQAQQELLEMREQAQRRIAEAGEKAAAISAQSENNADSILATAAAEAEVIQQKARASAQETARRITDEANHEAERIRKEAQERSDELRQLIILQTNAMLSQKYAQMELDRDEYDQYCEQREASIKNWQLEIRSDLSTLYSERAEIQRGRKLLEEDRNDLEHEWCSCDIRREILRKREQEVSDAEQRAELRTKALDNREEQINKQEKQLQPMVNAYTVLQLMYRHEHDHQNKENADSIKKALGLLRAEYNNSENPYLKNAIENQMRAQAYKREQTRIPVERRLPAIPTGIDVQ